MWTVSSQFGPELKKPVHHVATRVDFLDTDFKLLRSINAYRSDSPNDNLIDGTIDVDVDRATRRTLTMTLLNTDAMFSPDPIGGPWGATPDWDGYFYVNRLIRLWRGVQYESGQQELVPVGTFMVDKVETLVERGMSTVVVAGSDIWKKFTKSQFGLPRRFTTGTAINTIIATLADEAGVTLINLDSLEGRTSASKNIQRIFDFEAGDTRGDALIKICTDYGIEIYFNPMGVLTSKDFQNPFDRPTVWEFDRNDDLAYFLRSVIDDERLYNHVIVVGTGKADEGTIYKAELKNTDPTSATNIDRVGDRVFRFESSLLATQEATNKSAYTIFYKHFLLSNSVAIEAVCNPAIEGNDVVKVQETYTRQDNRFLISTFTVPLITSAQKMGMSQVLNILPA